MNPDHSPSIYQRLVSGIGSVLLIAFLGYLIFIISQSIWRNYQTNRKISGLKDVIEMMQIENDLRREMLTYYQSDSFREVELRRRLILQKPGEKVITLPIKKEDSNLDRLINISPTPSTNPKQNNTPNYIKWWQLFFGSTAPFR